MLPQECCHRRAVPWGLSRRSCLGRPCPWLTQRVCDARLHVGCADVADAVLVLWLGQDNDPDVPEGMDGYLQEWEGKRLYFCKYLPSCTVAAAFLTPLIAFLQKFSSCAQDMF